MKGQKCNICDYECGEWPEKLCKPHSFYDVIGPICVKCDSDLREGMNGIERVILRRGKNRVFKLTGVWGGK